MLYVPLAVDGSDAAARARWFFDNHDAARAMAAEALGRSRDAFDPARTRARLRAGIAAALAMQVRPSS